MDKCSDLREARLRGQRGRLGRFMVEQFVNGVVYKYGWIVQCPQRLPVDPEQTARFFQCLLQRAQFAASQFKTVCCIVIKFLESCATESNYMVALKHDLHKLIVTAFVLSVPNNYRNDKDKMLSRESCYAHFARLTGLSTRELTNCCSVVRPVIIRRNRHKLKAAQRLTASSLASLHGLNNSMTLNDFNEGRASTTGLASAFPNYACGQEEIDGRSSIPSTPSPTDAQANGARRPVDNGSYVSGDDIDQFNKAGRRLVAENFTIVQ
ncbi:uncharacterized protein KNAG_0A02250 [Huiozyma naganishii CBS 8797]|uniref:Uncharacterized protein n=1 Tax=Huiozyma naganishii (strain ATCC MYA-139 / BCRC 22969 / CBS 8797 / KCTC 17520 / NBRC 10181 / NCYC 3082 / Yp74L-3) TaxID=1071383 RepID=J7S202_HUIN7|nr:hypothetical protein KNAG_0A02250 [Kazachstania naganishii CBS 8797]CCK67914.1 hypothetical protein KNAG_0A02250 [Kazachstania naganishii CBS 8797]